MNLRYLLVILFSGLLLIPLWRLQSESVTSVEETPVRSQLRFVSNQGQWPQQVKHKLDFKGGVLYLEDNRLTYDLHEPVHDLMHPHPEHGHEHKHNHVNPESIKAHAFRVNFLNSNPVPVVVGKEQHAAYHNYYLGDDPQHWAGNVPLFRQVLYKSLYQDIDLRLYGQSDQLKYDYVVAAGANPSHIAMEYEGADQLSLNQGNLEVVTSVRTITEMAPVAYQYIDGQKHFVDCQYKLEGNVLSFDFPNGYQTQLELIIDPVVVFSTYSGSFADNWGFTATYDAVGNFYSGGIVFSSGYPTTSGAYDISFNNGPFDATITKFDPSGSSMIYSTYLGGGEKDQPHSLVVNNNEELLVYGRTESTNFPTTNNAYDRTPNGGWDIFVARFSANGNQLQSSTLIGGSGDDGLNIDEDYSVQSSLKYNYGDDARGEIIVDEANNVYIAACTKSSGFPVTGGVFQTSYRGSQDGIVMKLNPDLSNLIWASFIGGTGADAAYSVQLDDNRNVYVAGGTASSNFPVTSGAIYPNYRGGAADGFVAKINNSGSSLLRATYMGTNGYDQTYFVQLDKFNDVYVVGQSTGAFPVSAGVYSNPGAKQFIAKMDNNLSAFEYSTVFGSPGAIHPNISPTAFLVDVCQNVYIAGWGGQTNFNGTVSGMPITSDAFKPGTDGSDFHLTVFEKDAKNLLYATYYGGNSSADHVDGGTSRFDKEGIVYHAVCASCGGSSDFFTTPGAWSNTNNSSNCNIGSFKIAFDLSGLEAGFVPKDANFATIVDGGCEPFTVNMINTSSNTSPQTTYTWIYGDGSPNGSTKNPQHIYTTPGTYEITLIIFDPTSCNPEDTIKRSITVHPNPVAVVSQDETICEGDSVSLNASGGNAYKWSPFTGMTGSNTSNPTVFPTNNTTYTVTVTDQNGCKDTAQVDVIVDKSLQIFPAPDTVICFGGTAQLYSSSTNGTTYTWSPPLGLSNPNIANPTAKPDTTTTYTLIVENANGCTRDSQVTVEVYEVYTIEDTAICVGESVTLQTANGVSFSWSPATYLNNANLQSPVATPPSTITYTVTAISQEGCVSTKDVTVEVNPLPTITATDVDPICIGESTNLAANGGIAYVWTPASSLSNSQIQNPVASPTSTTTYTVTGTDANGCKNTDQVEVVVNPLPTIIATNTSAVVCAGDNATLLATGGISYTWSPGVGLSDSTIANPIASPDQSVIYTVTGTDANGCVNTDTVLVSVIPTPQTQVEGVNNICQGGSIVLTATGGTSYLWSNGETTESISVIPTGVEIYWVTAFVGDCEGTTDTITVDPYFGYPEANFEFMPLTGFAPIDVQFTNTSVGGFSYLWDFGTNVSGPPVTDPNPVYTYPVHGEFTVTLIVTNYQGCSDTIRKTILIEPVSLYVPTAFSPNGDAINDYFLAKHYGIKSLNVMIFSRWGMLIFESDNNDFTWDGTYKGKPVPEGAYVFVVTAIGENDKEYRKKGTVTLIR